MRRFVGRVAFVTGAAHGIGRAVVERLHAEGAAVALADVDVEAAETAAREVAASGGDVGGDSSVQVVACDVTETSSVHTAVAAVLERFGRLDVLVNNAGGSFAAEFEDLDDEDWRRIVDLNLQGAVRCIQAALPHLLASPVGGSIVSVGSVNGLAAVGDIAYSTAKAGLENLTRNLAVRYGRRTLRHSGSDARSVRVNMVAPGTIRTRVWTDMGEARLDQVERIRRLYPLDRVGEPDDVAAAVAFLASDDASWITGVTLPVDGGLLTGPIGTAPPGA
ncbi:SDR family oxidoreductase [Phytoactinopolyspora halotolerans]|uniref:SDR family oxidoreductase n=2 Tax=Phytoactinopolyspora halotolerans TaxID=1981512 RepID=A0A6L9SJG6_9ACTN|nr:SDR family oxidoreductase [Phytoactinopolyspora halotolerans]